MSADFATLEQIRKDAERYRFIKDQLGNMMDASEQTISLFQDEATREFVINIGRGYFTGGSLESAIEAAMKDKA